MLCHKFQEHQAYKFFFSRKRSYPDIQFMHTAPARTNHWFLGGKKNKPMWDEHPGPVCVVCSMLKDHPNHGGNHGGF